MAVITVATLLSGVIGSAIAAVAAFAAAGFTIWRTRVGDRRRESVRVHEREQERREAVVSEVLATLRGLEAEYRWAPLLAGRSNAVVLQATMRFYLSEREQHPSVAKWLLARQRDYDKLATHWRKVWWVPWLRRRRSGALAEFLGQTLGALVVWATGDLPDDEFADATRQPAMLTKAIAHARAQRSTSV